jgi:hypothetical protein
MRIFLVRQYLFAVVFTVCTFVSCSSFLRFPASAFPLYKVAYIDQRFTNNEQNQIAQAIKSWECSSGGQIHFQIIFNATDEDYLNSSSHDNLFIWDVDENNERIKETDKKWAHDKDGMLLFFTLGLYIEGGEESSPMILIVMDRARYRLVATTEHEIGHAIIDKNHSSDRNSIMYPDIDFGARKITDVDIASLCAKYHCDPVKLHACNL